MLRLPNPGSDISGFVRIFQFFYKEFENSQPFSLDDMSAALVKHNLATSSGFMGEEALERSTRDDRSRDPMFNQSKAYSELYRILGWIHPLPKSKGSFTFTYLGAHAAALRDPAPLIEQCLLGFVVPNYLVARKGEYHQRPFSLIVRTAKHLDGLITRDEIIAGPMSLENDRDTTSFEEMVEFLQSCRKTNKRLENRLEVYF